MLDLDYAIKLHVEGKLNEAEAVYRKILDSQPGNPNAIHLLGVIAYQRKQYKEAEELIRQAISIDKRVADFRNNLGNVYHAQGMLDKAEECYLKAVKLNPRYVEARNNLGNVLKDKGKFREAVDSYEKALKLDPARAEVHNNLGLVLDGLRRPQEAIEHFLEAIRLKPDFADAYSNLGAAYKNVGKLTETIVNCQKALQINPQLPKALFHMGNAYSELQKIESGIECYRLALRLDPDFCEAHMNLGHALREQGEQMESLEHFREAVRLKPKSLYANMGHCIGYIPLLHNSTEEIAQAREDYRRELTAFSENINFKDPHVMNQAAALVGNCQPFYLAYQGENDRELQSIYGSLMVKIQATCFPMWAKKVPMPAHKPGEPLRIGIASGFFCLHSNWKIPIKGWVDNLNRDDFQLYGYYTGTKVDDQTVAARQSFFAFREGLSSMEQWCDQIVKDRLHVLIYPEVGMDFRTVRLAALRLAPIQCTSWGHPDTSGFSTIDYYLSSELMEPEDGQDHYTEKLARLPNLSIYYEPVAIAAAAADRVFFGLHPEKTLFISTQSLFKYLPQYDDVFPRIAMEAGNCQFAFLNYAKTPRLGERFIQRLEEAFVRYGMHCADYVKMLPHLDFPYYRALNQVADVFLDSIGWSGCNSTFEALACNIPIATMPGRLMRGRHTHAILKTMGLMETEASDIEGYVAIAARLGKDPEYRKEISEKISRQKERAYRDMECIRGLEEFLKQAVASYS